FNHPLFKGECAMWRNILVRKYAGMPIRFYKDSKVLVSKNDMAATTEEKQAKTNIDRAMLLGAQALANAYGQKGGGHFNMVEKKTDMDNRTEIAI
ncbi:TPA: major capsid protein, partial [Escherichia coli]|nr:major capsid protein [Escherichia coli]